MSDLRDLRLNELLAALPPEVLLRLQPRLEWLELPRGQVLYLPGDARRHVFFPTTAIPAVPLQ